VRLCACHATRPAPRVETVTRRLARAERCRLLRLAASSACLHATPSIAAPTVYRSISP
jgi:hypothetical protein